MQETTHKAVIWDMDGVIADTARSHFLSWQFAFSKRNIPFTEEDFKHHFGQRNDTIIRDVAGSAIPDQELQAIAQDKEEYFRTNLGRNLKPFPGVINLLATLKENQILSAVASSAPLENIRLILTTLNISEYFQAIVHGQEVEQGKPSPQIFLLAAKKLGTKPANCIVIEDSIAGVMAAKNAGMHCIAVTNTHPAYRLAQADLVVDSLEKVDMVTLNRLFSDSFK